MSRLPALALLALGAACARSGGGNSGGLPIDATGLPLELVVCRGRTDDSFDSARTYASTLAGLGEREFASRAGIESGVRAHPTDPLTVVFARQTRGDQPESTELYLAAIDGSVAEVRLTRDNAVDATPCWSADGTTILFASDRSGASQLWRIGRDGSGLAPFTQPAQGAADRDPDARGDRVVFSRTEGGRARLWLANAQGGGLLPLTDGGGLVGPDIGDFEPALAPDASVVAFVRRDATGATRLHLVDVTTLQVTPLPAVPAGGDRQPRFLPGDRLLAARTVPADGQLGLRLVTMARDGSDVAWLSLDSRLTHRGFDVLAGARALTTPGAAPVAGDLDTEDTSIVIGRRGLGTPELLRSKDGVGVTLVTVPFDGHEVAGLFLPFKLPIEAAGDVARAQVRATCSVSVVGPQTRVRVSVQDYVRHRFDVAWDGTVASTNAFDVEFTFASLAHVDRNRWIRIEIACELPGGQRGEFTIDSVDVTVTPASR